MKQQPGERFHLSRSTRIVALALIAIVLIGGWLALRSHGGSLADPNSVALPTVATEQPVIAAYFKGEGAPLVQFVNATSILIRRRTPTRASCQHLAKLVLPAIGQPPALLGVASRVPDAATAQMVLADLDSTTRYLALCTQGHESDRTELKFTKTVLLRRLRDMGVQ